MGIDMSNYKMIYKDQVFNVINIMPTFGSPTETSVIQKPHFIDALAIDEDGELKMFHDEAFMFKFVRR